MVNLSPQLVSRLLAYDDAKFGPHSQAVWRDLCGAAAAGLPLAVVAFAAAMIDLVQHEDAGPAGYVDGAAFGFAGNKAALGWLRRRRNAILHHEGPNDGLMGEVGAARWLAGDAERAITIILDYLDDLKVGGTA